MPASTWSSVLAATAKLAAAPTPVSSRPVDQAQSEDQYLDPLTAVAVEMNNLTGNIRNLLGSRHSTLDTAAKYYVQSEGKHVRPLLVLLMSRATLLAPKSEITPISYEDDVNQSFSPLDILRDFNPSQIFSTIASKVTPIRGATPVPVFDKDTGILLSQRRLAEIVEMIHAASLLHDDVVDESELRRGKPSGNMVFGNKMSILAGDFLLGRASVALSRLRNAEVIELLATVIANLVEGEFMQLKNTATQDEHTGVATPETFNYYLEKTYLKTASLMSKSCRGAAVLSGAREEFRDMAYQYGRNLGLAFQLVDDLLDYTVTESDLGKPAGADLQLGLATAPALFAWQTYPELGDMIKRKFSEKGDVEKARELVQLSDGVEKTRQLAEDYSIKAREAIDEFPESPAKESLIDMTYKVLDRKK
ncbi:isoprenoid synthase domain-containing protein [Lipomyces japonicus]|uniref:isoprenoid synthase domain-containing protein n=1 Tax=Lipomyces japonicus TaxID=56871 RepID=UPI0034CD1C53